MRLRLFFLCLFMLAISFEIVSCGKHDDAPQVAGPSPASSIPAPAPTPICGPGYQLNGNTCVVNNSYYSVNSQCITGTVWNGYFCQVVCPSGGYYDSYYGACMFNVMPTVFTNSAYRWVCYYYPNYFMETIGGTFVYYSYACFLDSYDYSNTWYDYSYSYSWWSWSTFKVYKFNF